MSIYHTSIAEAIVRLFAGILFLFQGYDKLFRIGMDGVTNSFLHETERHHVPLSVIRFVAYFTSVAEFIGGALLMLGLFTNYALCALGVDLLIVCLAFSFLQPMWDMKHVFPRLILVVFLLMMSSTTRLFSLDHLFNF